MKNEYGCLRSEQFLTLAKESFSSVYNRLFVEILTTRWAYIKLDDVVLAYTNVISEIGIVINPTVFWADLSQTYPIYKVTISVEPFCEIPDCPNLLTLNVQLLDGSICETFYSRILNIEKIRESLDKCLSKEGLSFIDYDRGFQHLNSPERWEKETTFETCEDDLISLLDKLKIISGIKPNYICEQRNLKTRDCDGPF